MSKESSTVTITEKLTKIKPSKTFNYHKGGSITSLDFDDSGQYLISAGIDKSIQLYDVHKGTHYKDIQSQKYGAHLARFTHKDLDCLYVSTPSSVPGTDGANGKIDESDKDLNAIRYLSLADKKYIRYFRGHSDQVLSLEVDPVHDFFLTSSTDGTVKLWDTKTPSCTGNIDVGQSSYVAYDPHGIVIVVAKIPNVSGDKNEYVEGELEFYDAKSLLKPFMTTKISTKSFKWNKVEFSNTGKLILISTDGNEHYIIDAFSGQLITILTTGSRTNEIRSNYPNYGSSCFTTDGKYVLVGSSNSSLLIFDLTNLKLTNGSEIVKESDNPKKLLPLKTIQSNQGVPRIVSFNPKLFTLATADNSVSLWQPL